MLRRGAAQQLKCYHCSVSIRGPLNCQVFKVFKLASGERLQQRVEIDCIRMSSHTPATIGTATPLQPHQAITACFFISFVTVVHYQRARLLFNKALKALLHLQ